METLFQDIKYALRAMSKARAFTAVAVLTIALGIGANTAIFSIVNALMMRALPVEDPGKLDVIGNPRAVGWLSYGSPRTDLFSLPLYEEIVRGTEVYSSIAAVGRLRGGDVSLPGSDGNAQSQERARGRLVTGNYFSTLGLKTALGRTFTAEEDKNPGSAPVTVISYGYWTRSFGKDPNVIGKTLKVNNYPLTIIGVLPEGYYGDVVGEQQDYYVPMMMQSSVMPGHDWLKAQSTSWVLLIGRRKPGYSLAQAQASTKVQMQRIVESSWAAKFGEEDRAHLRRQEIKVSEGGKGLSSLREQFRKPLLLLSVIVGLVLLIACVNVANLLLARSAARQNEMAVRLALGASAGRVVRQLITESVVLSIVGGACGLLLAKWASVALVRAVTKTTGAAPLDLSLDATVLAVSLGISVVTGILFGLAPALRARSIDLTPSLKANAKNVLGSGAKPTLGKLLVAGQLAISVFVLFVAMLLVRSLQQLQQVDTGFQRQNLLSATVDVLPAGYKGPQVISIGSELLNRVRNLPGVTAASFSENGLFAGSENATTILVDGKRPEGREERVSAYDAVGANFLSTIGVPIISGRDITDQDTPTSPRVVLVNETFAKFYFPGQNPVGHSIAIDDPETAKQTMEIIGIVKDARDHNLRDKAERRFYQPYTQYPPSSANGNFKFELRYTGDVSSLSENLRRTVTEMNQAIRISEVSTVDALIQDKISDDLTVVRMTGLFAVLALILACVGLYGIISYSVAGRTREIGVRIALGANRFNVLWLILRDALVLIGVGIAIGLPLSALGSRAVQSMMYGVSLLDPVVIAATMGVLAAVGMLAAYVPARRASKVDPMVALRYE